MSREMGEKSYRDSFLEILAEVEDTYYKPEEIPLIRKFIDCYTPINDFSSIRFSWNGGHGSDFKDFNQDFRDKVSVFICLNNDIKVPHSLLKDLVEEIGKASLDAWGVSEHVFLLAERLLKETGRTYIETFGKMLFSNMDTYGACLCMDFKDIDVKAILNELRGKEPKSKLIMDLIEYLEAHL